MREYPTGTSARPPLYNGRRHQVLWVAGVVFSAGLLAPLLFLGAARKGIVPRPVPAGYAVAIYPIALGRQWLPDPGNWISWTLVAVVLTAAVHAALLDTGRRPGG
ncbi:hypothetical protein [Streptomyces melanosporofaciens]|uniref:Uncharacterized protein n=1 Tax=Streptomyces melanosporofaciens TaxID=67327 RepID=A0A1H5BPT0_STRMJ|nr:hypothetical protein [Streptomyces melanosporofaciens]SED56415.1 hypothetical protein SAMN04490356_8993 [Streptomyces melanosporofaciens]